MHRKDGKANGDIYENPDVIHGKVGKEFTDSTQGTSSELTGSDFVRIRRSRAAAVCVALLLCVFLLIVLCVRFIEERQRLMSTNANLTNERDQIIFQNKNLTNERDQLIFQNKNLTNERDQLKEILIPEGWTLYQHSIYYMSNEAKNWAKSRRHCRERGADLIIINNGEEQSFVENTFGGTSVYIGLTDSEVEGQWKWVDGSTLTSGFSFWGSGEPDGGTAENCVVTVNQDPRIPAYFRWCDVACDKAYQWVCEKRILPS